MPEYIDLTQSIDNNTLCFPGDPPLELRKTAHFETNNYTLFSLSMGLHSGTHIDGPMHMTDSKLFISDFSVEFFIGNGILLDARGQKRITAADSFLNKLTSDAIAVVLTGHSALYGSAAYYEDFPVLDESFARQLSDRKVKMVCLDTPSADQYPWNAHKTLFNAGVLIAENLTRLERLLPLSEFEIIALPLKTVSDSAPARIIARY